MSTSCPFFTCRINSFMVLMLFCSDNHFRNQSSTFLRDSLNRMFSLIVHLLSSSILYLYSIYYLFLFNIYLYLYSIYYLFVFNIIYIIIDCNRMWTVKEPLKRIYLAERLLSTGFLSCLLTYIIASLIPLLIVYQNITLTSKSVYLVPQIIFND